MCGCHNRIVHDSKGGCTPVIHGEHLIHSCRKGPDETVQAPQYLFTVENPPDDVLRDGDGKPVLVDGKVVARES